jgi:hypothetical protein
MLGLMPSVFFAQLCPSNNSVGGGVIRIKIGHEGERTMGSAILNPSVWTLEWDAVVEKLKRDGGITN